ncbi:MAG: AAA family ATPase, partial [Vulcanisaeta sp.]|nr:AAA family ATPase [Vulcanisaeta sp.]MCG2892965.1 AAA family ATPase [Vulcanisaeta sp.]
FDRIVYVPPPDEKARFEILKVHVRNIKLADDVKDGNYKYLRDLARRTEGYTGADLAALVREAAMLALRETIKSGSGQAKPVGIEHFEEALKIVPPSLTRQDIARYEEIARNLRRALRGL